ncbi:MAG: outer membrane lipoprotein-sorting protein [Candidatus Auribacterota bacterium]|nr:outer membrane lipoprotein-sorting protein [Candidatus Auribacterota bacterium]
MKNVFYLMGEVLLISLFAFNVSLAGENKDTAPLSVDEIVNNTNRVAYYQAQDGKAQVSMEIKDKQGRTRNRQFSILRVDQPDPETPEGNDNYMGDQKFYIFFKRPADVNKMAFMVWKHADQDTEDDRWLYLPALDLVKRISGTEKRTSFVGSDFFYEDVSGRNISEDIHELEKTTGDYYVLKNTPKDPSSVEFKYFTMWIHKDTFIPVKIEYFDKNGEKYREYTALGVDTIQGNPTVTKASMKNLKTGSETTISYKKVNYDIDLPDDIFTERYLRKPPRKYLR